MTLCFQFLCNFKYLSSHNIYLFIYLHTYNLIIIKKHCNTHTSLLPTNKSSSPFFTSEHFCAIRFRPFEAFLTSHNLPTFSHAIPPLNLTVINAIQIAFIFQLNVQKEK